MKSAVAVAMIAALPAACAGADPSEDGIAAEGATADDIAAENGAAQESTTEESIAQAEQELSWDDCLKCGSGDYCNGNWQLVKGTNIGGKCSWTFVANCPNGCHESACGSHDYCNP